MFENTIFLIFNNKNYFMFLMIEDYFTFSNYPMYFLFYLFYKTKNYF